MPPTYEHTPRLHIWLTGCFIESFSEGCCHSGHDKRHANMAWRGAQAEPVPCTCDSRHHMA